MRVKQIGERGMTCCLFKSYDTTESLLDLLGPVAAG